MGDESGQISLDVRAGSLSVSSRSFSPSRLQLQITEPLNEFSQPIASNMKSRAATPDSAGQPISSTARRSSFHSSEEARSILAVARLDNDQLTSISHSHGCAAPKPATRVPNNEAPGSFAKEKRIALVGGRADLRTATDLLVGSALCCKRFESTP